MAGSEESSSPASQGEGHFARPDCEVCGAKGAPLYANLPDHTFDSGYTQSLVRCSNEKCGTIWADPFPTPETILGYYGSYFTHGADAPSASPRREAKPDRIKPLLRRLAGAVFRPAIRFRPKLRYLGGRKPGALLDVGCGSGGFLAEAKAAGWQVAGQEFDPQAASAAREMTGAQIRLGELREAAFDAASFDAVTMSNVFEHLFDPRGTLEEVHRLLVPGGVFVSLSPNPESYLHRRYGRHWRGLEVPRHLFLLTPSAKKRMCEEAGFAQVEAFSTLGAFGFMELESARIRQLDMPGGKPFARTSAVHRAWIMAQTMMGREIGEWTVVIARKGA